jgi:hypothetical protein
MMNNLKKIWISENLSLSLFCLIKTIGIMKKETKKVWEELISIYDIADQLEDNGQEKDAEEVRIKLNNITNFFVKNFKKDLE